MSTPKFKVGDEVVWSISRRMVGVVISDEPQGYYKYSVRFSDIVRTFTKDGWFDYMSMPNCTYIRKLSKLEKVLK